MNQQQDWCRLVESYHDDDLPDELRQSFQHHLESCPECAEELNQLQQIDADVVSAWNAVQVSAPDVDKAKLAARRDASRWWLIALAALVACVLASLVLVEFSNRQSEQHSNQAELSDVNPPPEIENRQSENASNELAELPLGASLTGQHSTFTRPVARTRTLTVYNVYSKPVLLKPQSPVSSQEQK